MSFTDNLPPFPPGAYTVLPPSETVRYVELDLGKNEYWVMNVIYYPVFVGPEVTTCGPGNDELCPRPVIWERGAPVPVTQVVSPGCFSLSSVDYSEPTGHNHDTISVNLEPVQTNLIFASPTWEHASYDPDWGTNADGKDTIIWTKAVYGSGIVPYDTMFVGDKGLRLTGGNKQIEKTSDAQYSGYC